MNQWLDTQHRTEECEYAAMNRASDMAVNVWNNSSESKVISLDNVIKYYRNRYRRYLWVFTYGILSMERRILAGLKTDFYHASYRSAYYQSKRNSALASTWNSRAIALLERIYPTLGDR